SAVFTRSICENASKLFRITLVILKIDFRDKSICNIIIEEEIVPAFVNSAVKSFFKHSKIFF
ncbi:MAG: hypothetical protein K2G88_05415, partial [Oscillospiraceae bacterium]|nr:hypothetical protein [Oscillospiraceae bacterium]